MIAASINIDNLGLFDAHFAVAVASSNGPDTLFQKARLGHYIIRALSLAFTML